MSAPPHPRARVQVLPLDRYCESLHHDLDETNRLKSRALRTLEDADREILADGEGGGGGDGSQWGRDGWGGDAAFGPGDGGARGPGEEVSRAEAMEIAWEAMQTVEAVRAEVRADEAKVAPPPHEKRGVDTGGSAGESGQRHDGGGHGPPPHPARPPTSHETQRSDPQRNPQHEFDAYIEAKRAFDAAERAAALAAAAAEARAAERSQKWWRSRRDGTDPHAKREVHSRASSPWSKRR